jgi:hypothetical protein
MPALCAQPKSLLNVASEDSDHHLSCLWSCPRTHPYNVQTAQEIMAMRNAKCSISVYLEGLGLQVAVGMTTLEFK